MVNAKSRSGFNKEDELLLQDFSKNVSGKCSALLYVNAFIVSGIPIWLYWRIHSLELVGSSSNLIMLAVMTVLCTWLVSFAYRNVKHILKHKIAVKREAAVNKEMNKKFADDKKISRKEKDERILWKNNEVAEFESSTFSIFYNNALFLAILIFCSFYLLKGLSPQFNYIFSMGVASGIIALLSTGSQI
uniref:Translocon-associated protein subunit gamma n=1 Tax=Caligus clemensi TaxID=344056 RepID=C1C2I5_CALCM|nr:Translocon-associated protein subunit gamma [Caligus clemensi]